MPHRVSQPPRPTQHGFTLLEVLISILVLAIGVTGMVGLQAASIQANRDARQQSAAVRLAVDLAEKMRTNKATAITVGSANPYLMSNLAGGSLPPTGVSCLTTTCASGLQVAQADARSWFDQVVNVELPGAKVVVCFDTSPYDASGLPQWNCTNTGDTMVVKIGWTRLDTGKGASAPSQDLNLAVRPSVVTPLTPGAPN